MIKDPVNLGTFRLLTDSEYGRLAHGIQLKSLDFQSNCEFT